MNLIILIGADKTGKTETLDILVNMIKNKKEIYLLDGKAHKNKIVEKIENKKDFIAKSIINGKVCGFDSKADRVDMISASLVDMFSLLKDRKEKYDTVVCCSRNMDSVSLDNMQCIMSIIRYFYVLHTSKNVNITVINKTVVKDKNNKKETFKANKKDANKIFNLLM